MLVADACSGLHSMYSLSALGTLFMYIMARRSRLHNAIMLASILPIAFVANIVRVIVLVLITYHFGDEAGQGFLHGAAGMVLMLVALRLLLRPRCAAGAGCSAADARRRERPRSAGPEPTRPRPASGSARAPAAAVEPAQLPACLGRHGRHHVGRELLLHRERPGRVVVDRRDPKQQAVGDLAGEAEPDLRPCASRTGCG